MKRKKMGMENEMYIKMYNNTLYTVQCYKSSSDLLVLLFSHFSPNLFSINFIPAFKLPLE